MKNNMTEKIQRIWGKSLKNLKNLMQIFKRPAVVSVRTVPVESTVKVAQRSRIPSYLPLLATDSILSRICLVSLILMSVGVGEMWGDDTTTNGIYSPNYVTKNGASAVAQSLTIGNDKNSKLSGGDYVFTDGNGVTFTLDLEGGNISYYSDNLNLGEGSRGTHKSTYLSWQAPTNYDITVTKIELTTRVYIGNTARCNIGAQADGTTGTEVQNTVGSNTTFSKENNTSTGFPNRLLIDYYYADSYGWAGSRQTYIAGIKVSYQLTYKSYIFGFAAQAESNNESYGTATAALSIAPKDTLQGGPGVTSKSVTATYTATPADGCQFIGWYSSDDEYGTQVSIENPYPSTLTNSTAGSTLTRTLYAKFTNKLDKSITWNQTINDTVRSAVLTMTASVPEGESITYTASPAGLVSISGSTVTCLKAGDVTITASSGETTKYFAAEDVTQSFTIYPHAITTTPSASGTLTYEQKLNTISPTGGAVTDNIAGSWAWKYPNSIPNAGTANQVAVFTPSSSVIDTVPLECNVSVTVNKANPDVTCTVNANTHYVDDTKIDLQSTWTREGDGAITYSVLSFEESGKNNEDGTTPYVESNRYLHLQKAGTAQVKMAVAEGTNYIARNETINVVINKHDPVFTWHAPSHYYYNSTAENIFTTTGTNDTTVRSDNPAVRVVANTLYISPTFDETHITLTQAENYYWNYKDSVVTFTPETRDNHLPITSLTETNASTYSVSMSGEAKWETKGGKSVMTFGNGTWWFSSERPDGYAVFTFTGIPDTLRFKTFCTAVASNYPAKEDYVFEVYESPDNSSWSLRWRCDNTSGFEGSENDNANRSLSLSPTTRYVKFHYKGSCYAHYSDIQVTEKYQFVANEGEKIFDFGSKGAKYGVQVERLIFDHANAGSMTRAEILSGADAACFTLNQTTITGTGRDKSGSFVLSVSFDNNDNTGRESSDYTAKLRIYDNRGNADTVTLKGHRWGLTAPEFTWNQHHMPYYHNTTISNVVVSTNTDYENCPFTYSSSDDDIAYVDGAGTLHIGEKSGSVTITVSQATGNNYSSLEKTFTFTPIVAPSLKVPFYLNNTIYTSGSVAIADGTTGAWDSESANDIRLGDGSVTPSSWGTKVFVIAFSDAPDKVSFRYKTNSTNTSRGWNRLMDLLGAPMWTIEESATGATWDTVWNETSNSDFWKYETVQLSPRAQYVRFTYNGNGYGYFGNIQVTALDGYKFMRTEDGKYLSRGGKYGTQAVLDEIGVAVRVTRYTLDNVHDTTLVQFVDSREYLFEDLDGGIDEVYTDNGSRTSMKWKQIRNADTLIVKSLNGTGKFITLVGDSLKMTDDSAKATKWIPESATVRYNKVSTKLGTLAARAAFCEFGKGANTLERVRTEINHNDYDKIDVTIPHLNDKVYEANVSGEGREAAGMRKVYSDTIGGLIPGFYRLTVQAMYQTGADPNDWENNQLGVESQIAYVYANDGFYPVKSRYDISGRQYGAYGTGNSISKDNLTYYPNDATAAGEAFATPSNYVNDVYAYVGDDSTLIYGIKNPSYVPGERLFYKNFTLTRICRKEFIYRESVGDEWDKLDYWQYHGESPDMLPTINHNVTIKSDITIEGELNAYRLKIDDGVTVTIAPTGGLTIGAGGITGATKDNLKLMAGTGPLDEEGNGYTKGLTGYLRISPKCAEMPNASVEVFSKAFYDRASGEDNIAAWQCLGSPIVGDTLAKKVFTESWIYNWNETIDDGEDGGWKNNRSKLKLAPFTGYLTTQYKHSEGTKLTFTGKLVPTEDSVYVKLSREATGRNFLANSYTAPIAISNFNSSDFVDAEQTIYILNTGSRKDEMKKADGVDAPGKFVAIPIKTADKLAEDGYPVTIAPLQGFMVKAKMMDRTCDSSALKFNYERLVYNVDYTEDLYETPQPLRAPKRTKQADNSDFGKMKITLEADGWTDYMYLLESEDYNEIYEDGYDAHKIFSEGAEIFAVEGDEEYMSVDATNSIIGTRVGVRTSAETAYTLSFNYVSDEEWALYDAETENTIDINEGMEYTFFAEPNSNITERFMIVERADAPNVTTGVDNTQSDVKASKFIKDGQLFILKNGVLYDATGARVR